MMMIDASESCHHVPVDTGRKLNAHKTFRGRRGRLLSVLYTFSLRPVSTEMKTTMAPKISGTNPSFRMK